MKRTSKAKQRDGPWNKGKAPGQMAPFTPDQVRLIRSILELEGNLRDRALFETAVSTMLRGSDLLALCVDDVMDHEGQVLEEIQLRQKKTGEGHLVALSTQAQRALLQWIHEGRLAPGDYLFFSTRRDMKGQPLSSAWFRKLVKRWAGYARLDPRRYSGHSLRRTKSAAVYAKTQNLAACQQLLGHKSIGSTAQYLGVDKRQALDLAKEIEL